jgi:hypothetical protein
MFQIPRDAEVLDAQVQNEVGVMWVLVNPYNDKELRSFVLYPTGQFEFDSSSLTYISTLQYDDGEFVLHLFEKVF